MNKASRIFVAGHRGLVGSAILRSLSEKGFQKILTANHADLDLENGAEVNRFFQAMRPDVVIIAAAKVGGILANNTSPYDFIYKNLQIELNVINAAHSFDVAELVFLGSSCIYPKLAAQPITEDALLTGELEITNRAYAIAKIAGIELCWSLNRQFGRQYFTVMPTNLYGIEDNFDLETSHVLPALIRKFHAAKVSGAESVVVWGTGAARREFLFNDDLADAIVFLLSMKAQHRSKIFRSSAAPMINIGSGFDISIRELAELVKDIVGYEGQIQFDASKPDGTLRKLLDSSKISALGWTPNVSLVDGIKRVYLDRNGQF